MLTDFLSLLSPKKGKTPRKTPGGRPRKTPRKTPGGRPRKTPLKTAKTPRPLRSDLMPLKTSPKISSHFKRYVNDTRFWLASIPWQRLLVVLVQAGISMASIAYVYRVRQRSLQESRSMKHIVEKDMENSTQAAQDWVQQLFRRTPVLPKRRQYWFS